MDYLYMSKPDSLEASHDVHCLRLTDLFTNWRRYFQNENRDIVEEYLLGDPGYMGAEMFILRRVDNREADAANPVIRAYNKRHAAIRVQVEWGIGGLKKRFKRFLGTCPTPRDLLTPVFESCCKLTNFIHRSALILPLSRLAKLLRITSTMNFPTNGQCDGPFIHTFDEPSG
jgi:hypothetical protein